MPCWTRKTEESRDNQSFINCNFRPRFLFNDVGLTRRHKWSQQCITTTAQLNQSVNQSVSQSDGVIIRHFLKKKVSFISSFWRFTEIFGQKAPRDTECGWIYIVNKIMLCLSGIYFSLDVHRVGQQMDPGDFSSSLSLTHLMSVCLHIRPFQPGHKHSSPAASDGAAPTLVPELRPKALTMI